ncbi:MAG: FAD-binding oxidoreductase [Firmicutes bacterium]|nr:FAD-binding oxidoreductase [Bacillota bacterium]
MKLVSGNMIWTEINNIPEKYLYLSEDLSCDVVIIGGGITGAITAYYFTSAGINTVLVDKNIIGFGSTSASTSILQYEIDTNLIGLKTMIGEDNAAKSFKLCHKAVYDIQRMVEDLNDDCRFAFRDCLYYSENRGEVDSLKDEYDLREKYDFDVEFIDKEKGAERFDFPLEAGIYSRKGSAEIDPYKFTHELIKRSIAMGLKVYENTEVAQIKSDSKGVIIKTKNDFSIKASKAIITTGFEAVNYFNEEIVKFYRTFTIATSPLEKIKGWYNQCIIRDTNSPYYYVRPTLDNRLIIGGEDIQIMKRKSKIANLSEDSPQAIEKYNNLIKRIKYLFPNIPKYNIDFRFNGIFGVTTDGLPYIGEYERMENCYFNLGYGANGILYAVLGGQLLRELYLGKESNDLKLFRFHRPSVKINTGE